MTLDTWPSGLLSALVTPLTDDRVDPVLLTRLVEHQIECGVAGFVAAGGTGEFGALSLEERQLLATEVVQAVRGRVPVIVQTGALSTRDALALSRHAEAAGADAIMVASPFGEPINWSERYSFYATLTSNVSLPMMIYNTPPSGLLSLEQIQQLAQLPHIEAVKDSSGSPALLGDLIEWADPLGVAIYVGLDSLLYDAMRSGARGAVFGAANVIPGPLSSLARSVQVHGATPESAALWSRLRPFLRFMERSANYVALCKAGLAVAGLPMGTVRAPYLMPDEDEITELRKRFDDVMQAFEDCPLIT